LFVSRLLIRHNVLLDDNLVAATILEKLADFVKSQGSRNPAAHLSTGSSSGLP